VRKSRLERNLVVEILLVAASLEQVVELAFEVCALRGEFRSSCG